MCIRDRRRPEADDSQRGQGAEHQRQLGEEDRVGARDDAHEDENPSADGYGSDSHDETVTMKQSR